MEVEGRGHTPRIYINAGLVVFNLNRNCSKHKLVFTVMGGFGLDVLDLARNITTGVIRPLPHQQCD